MTLATVMIVTGSAFGQAPAAGSEAASDPDVDVVRLPVFEINETPANPYRSGQALSASRVALNIQDIPQTVSVVTGEFIQDSISHRMLDAVKYITPVAESSLPIGGDRYQIRGFQVSHEFVDGAEISGADGYSMSIAPYNIDRIEVIKGPNAILVPGGSPGGQFNPITKSPIMKNQTAVTLEVGQYFSNAISFDANRIISDERRMAGRMVFALWHSTGYMKNHIREGYMIAPSFSWQISPNHKFVAKVELMKNDEAQIGGVPLDPSVGSNGHAIIAKGLPRSWTFGDGKLDIRHRETERLTLELHSSVGDHISSRLQLIGNHVVREDAGGTGAAIIGASATGSRNPNTGLYEPGVIWSVNQTGPNAIATSTTVALPNPSTYVYQRNYGAVDLFYKEAHLRNDYAIKFDGDTWKSTTITGLASNFSNVQFKSFNSQPRPNVPGNNLASITYPAYNYREPSVAAGGGNRTGELSDLQLYVSETANLWSDRVILSAGASRYFGRLTRTDFTGLGVPVPPAPYYPTYNLTSDAVSWGIVGKPIKNVSLFYGYNTSGGAMPGQLNAGGHAPDFRVQVGNQKEFGVKTSWLDEKLNLSFSHFDIAQSNYPVPNSEYYTLVAQGIPVPADYPTVLYLNQVSKGWEFEASYAAGRNLTIFANYSDYKARQATGVRIRGNPDTIMAAYVDYRFSEGPLTGFGFNIGIDNKSDVAGENVSGLTTAKPLPGGNVVLQQPSFFIAGRTLVNLGVTYRRNENWTARLQLNNALDKDYILAAGSRTSVIVGDPRNVKGSITYRF